MLNRMAVQRERRPKEVRAREQVPGGAPSAGARCWCSCSNMCEAGSPRSQVGCGSCLTLRLCLLFSACPTWLCTTHPALVGTKSCGQRLFTGRTGDAQRWTPPVAFCSVLTDAALYFELQLLRSVFREEFRLSPCASTVPDAIFFSNSHAILLH